MNQPANRILIIGKPGTSKTTFLAQLFEVLQLGRGRLRLLATPANTVAIEQARRRLAAGKSTQSTPASQNQTLRLSLQLADQPLELEFPDYGGEQVDAIIQERQLGPEWVQMCRESDDWLLFIRLHDHEEPHDVLTKATAEVEPAPQLPDPEAAGDLTTFHKAVELIELLQLLLAVRELGIQQPLRQPRLKLVLTLWDELHTTDRPEQVLAARLPLLLEFARSNWASEALQVWGLSAQGFRLDTVKNQDKYLDGTPSEHAYVVLPEGGEPVHDLSRLFG